MTLVSIGIPTYNRAELVCEAIESVLAQTYKPIEIVVVDDGSTDDTEVRVRAYRPHAEALRYVKFEKNRGIAPAKNAALTEGSGVYRGILDSDDFYRPGFVEACVSVLDAKRDVGFVYTDNILVRNQTDAIQLMPALDWSLDAFLKTRNLRGDSWLARWSVLQETALHDERFTLDVDYDLFYQLIPITTFQRIPKALQCVRVHNGQHSTVNSGKAAAYWHAAGLGKYGFPIHYAFERSREYKRSRPWRDNIEKGYAMGQGLREQHWAKAVKDVAQRRGHYNERQVAYYQEIHEKSSAFLDVGGKMLDVGCGDGSSRRFKPGITEYTGIDVFLTKPAPDLHEASAESIPFSANTFDSVLCNSVLQHIMHPERALQEIARVLKPRGRFASLTCIDDPNPIFCWFWNKKQLVALIGKYFEIVNVDVLDNRHCMVNALKRS